MRSSLSEGIFTFSRSAVPYHSTVTSLFTLSDNALPLLLDKRRLLSVCDPDEGPSLEGRGGRDFVGKSENRLGPVTAG